MENGEENGLRLQDALDAQIVMHRDAHFGGNFDEMLAYYARGGKGVQPEFELERIEELAAIEAKMQQNLAGVLLSGSDAEQIAQSRQMYKELRNLYEKDDPKTKNARLIADLILSEDPEGSAEIEAIVKEKATVVPALLQLIQSEPLHNPLFPGYGLAPNLAIKSLGRIGDKRAIITLFEAVGTGDFFDDDIALEALGSLGEPAKVFLLKVLHGRPVTIDNEKAAIALLAFKEDAQVGSILLEMLQDPQVRQHLAFATYLALLGEGLNDEQLRSSYKVIAQDPATPKQLRQDMEIVMKSWK